MPTLVLFLVILTDTFWIYIIIIDTPNPIYHCPLNQNSVHQWTDENCYWISSYAEAREKFVALGNVLREQEQLAAAAAADRILDVVDVKSISYDVSDQMLNRYGSAERYLDTLVETGPDQSQTILPGRDTIDVILLTICVPNNNDKEHVDVIHRSGVHGVEGYLGSAIQIWYLHELILRNEQEITSSAKGYLPSTEYKSRKVLLIHSVNPYGMRHHRQTVMRTMLTFPAMH
ncbi:hypothetical protein ACHAXN_009553 [Cyclotella atomus]